MTWKPDITFLATQDQLDSLVSEPATAKLDLVMDLIAHKQPTLRVLEISLEPSDACSLWFGAGNFSATNRWAYSQYDFASTNPKSLIRAQSQFESRRDTSFHLASLNKKGFGLPLESLYDLVIIKAPMEVDINAEDLTRHLECLLFNNAYTLLIQMRYTEDASTTDIRQMPAESPSSSSEQTSPSPSKTSSIAEGLTPPSSESSVLDESVPKSTPSHADHYIWDHAQLQSLAMLSIPGPNDTPVAYICGPHLKNDMHGSDVVIADFPSVAPVMPFQSKLENSGWNVKHQMYPFKDLKPGVVVLVLEEMFSPMLATANREQWEGVKDLVNSGNPILWVTEGAQYHVTSPDRALVHGLFRVARRENRNAKLTTLDVEYNSNLATHWAVKQVLEIMNSKWQENHLQNDTEYVDRGGVIYVQRVIPDTAVNAFKRAERDGNELVERPFHETIGNSDCGRPIQLRADRLGTLQSLAWCETGARQATTQENHIEVKVIASGRNFKDVATIMGIVPGDESKLGYECAGIVTRVGNGADKFSIGDRVCALMEGSYANRLEVPVGRVRAIPSNMSFQDAATIPLVFLTSIYALLHLANLKQGQSVLIQSGASGVGIACIQIAQYRKAEIYVTVGTEEKRNFLSENYGLARDRIFSSRSTAFAEEIKSATRGHGIDVIVNSLPGKFLDASWRLCADGGTLIEIGKKDILDRNVLSMGPFGRNCSFRALDFSYSKDIGDDLIARFVVHMR